LRQKIRELDKVLESKIQLDNILNEEEIRMIMLYTSDSPRPIFSDMLNFELRKEEREGLVSFFPLLRLLLLSLFKLPRYEGIVWKLIGLEKKTNFLSYDYLPGNKFFWRGFTSCTTNMTTVKQFMDESKK